MNTCVSKSKRELWMVRVIDMLLTEYRRVIWQGFTVLCPLQMEIEHLVQSIRLPRPLVSQNLNGSYGWYVSLICCSLNTGESFGKVSQSFVHCKWRLNIWFNGLDY